MRTYALMSQLVSALKNPALLFVMVGDSIIVSRASDNREIARVSCDSIDRYGNELFEIRLPDGRWDATYGLNNVVHIVENQRAFPKRFEHKNYSRAKLKADLISWAREEFAV